MMNGSSKFLAGHHSPPITGKADNDTVRVRRTRGYGSRDAIPHRPTGRGQLSAVLPVAIKTLRPAREIPCIVNQYRVIRKYFIKVIHHYMHIEITNHWQRWFPIF